MTDVFRSSCRYNGATASSFCSDPGAVVVKTEDAAECVVGAPPPFRDTTEIKARLGTHSIIGGERREEPGRVGRQLTERRVAVDKLGKRSFRDKSSTYHESLQRIGGDGTGLAYNHYQQHWFSTSLEVRTIKGSLIWACLCFCLSRVFFGAFKSLSLLSYLFRGLYQEVCPFC